MDDPLCRNFFLHPTHTQQRRYEALRAFFVDRRPLGNIAQAFGYRYGTLRNLVSRLRSQCHAGQMPPFSIRLAGDDPTTTMSMAASLKPNPLRSPIAGNSASFPVVRCVPAWPASFSSFLFWPGYAWTPSSSKPVILDHGWCPPLLPSSASSL